jgi:hypothetical protein
VDREAHILERVVRRRELVHAKDLFLGRLVDLWEDSIDAPSDHTLQQNVHRHLCSVVRRHQSPITQDGHSVGDARDLFKAMADIDEAHPLLPQLINLCKEPLCFLSAERCGRFVQNQELGIEGECLGDFHLLLGGNPKRANERGRGNIQA